jgi:hypothetical protein
MAGATTAQIMDITGHREPKSLRRYPRRELLLDPRVNIGWSFVQAKRSALRFANKNGSVPGLSPVRFKNRPFAYASANGACRSLIQWQFQKFSAALRYRRWRCEPCGSSARRPCA